MRAGENCERYTVRKRAVCEKEKKKTHVSLNVVISI